MEFNFSVHEPRGRRGSDDGFSRTSWGRVEILDVGDETNRLVIAVYKGRIREGVEIKIFRPCILLPWAIILFINYFGFYWN